MLSGAKARDARIVAAFSEPGETLVGWVALGTAGRALAPKAASRLTSQLLADW